MTDQEYVDALEEEYDNLSNDDKAFCNSIKYRLNPDLSGAPEEIDGDEWLTDKKESGHKVMSLTASQRNRAQSILDALP